MERNLWFLIQKKNDEDDEDDESRTYIYIVNLRN